MNITKKDLAMAAAGAIDPLLNSLATHLANQTPRASMLHSKKLELAIGVIKGFIESRAGNLSLPAHVLLEKVTDFSDFFSGALRMSKEKQKEFTDSFLSKFFEDASKRLDETENVAEEIEKLRAEMELRLSLVDLTTEKTVLQSSSRFRRQNVRLLFTEIENRFSDINNSLERRLTRRRNGSRHTQSSSQTQKGE